MSETSNGGIVRLLALVNITLIPYVLVRFPREAGKYAQDSFRCLLDGKRR